MGLATLAGNLKNQGFQAGLQQEDFGTSGLANYVSNEGNLASNAAGQDFNRNMQQYGLNAQASEQNKNRLSNLLMTAANVAMPFIAPELALTNTLTQALMGNSNQRRSAVLDPRGYVGNSYYPGGYSSSGGLIR